MADDSPAVLAARAPYAAPKHCLTRICTRFPTSKLPIGKTTTPLRQNSDQHPQSHTLQRGTLKAWRGPPSLRQANGRPTGAALTREDAFKSQPACANTWTEPVASHSRWTHGCGPRPFQPTFSARLACHTALARALPTSDAPSSARMQQRLTSYVTSHTTSTL